MLVNGIGRMAVRAIQSDFGESAQPGCADDLHLLERALGQK